jgi:hypothetical protein
MPATKVMRYKLFFVKALSKRLQKLTIKMQRLIEIKIANFKPINC